MEAFSKYNFSAINFKKEVASRFREFAKQLSKTNTEALESMLNFFYWNQLLPDDDMGMKADGTKKRINALIAIVKNIEKHQTKPTAAMLKALFEETSNLVEEEERIFEKPDLISENEELEYYRNRYFRIQENYSGLRNELQTIFGKIVQVKGSFGKGYLKLDMTLSELETIEQKLQDVHYNHSAETGQ